ncbi:MAG: zinc ribbon domain-containing protein [Polyangiales bacterium]|nr:zinc ribbon domain-containing protein [Myxococcales bacterium]MCB9658641.1 zinc ribbon domain-containing protein [Sandaracinaceae bacterium]
MSAVPAVCPVCSTPIPSGATRCPGCARVFGEDNRCPHCHAVAGVRARGGGYVCVACNKPRTVKPGTVVLGGDGAGAAMEPVSGAQLELAAGRSAGTALRAFGAFSMAAGVLGAGALLLVFPFGAGVVVGAAALGLAGVGVGGLSVRAGNRAGDAAIARAKRKAELDVLRLAEQRGGVLTVTDVATELHMTSADAEQLLTNLAADGARVSVDISSEGVVLFRFVELVGRGPKVRVAPVDELSARFEELEARERQRAREAEHEG